MTKPKGTQTAEICTQQKPIIKHSKTCSQNKHEETLNAGSSPKRTQTLINLAQNKFKTTKVNKCEYSICHTTNNIHEKVQLHIIKSKLTQYVKNLNKQNKNKSMNKH